MRRYRGKRNQKRAIGLGITAAILLVLVIGCGIYVGDFYRADETALSALESDKRVTVERIDGAVVFAPENPVSGLIFYPGGKVEHTAYAPLMRGLAERGVLCVLTEMPFQLAVLDADAADGIPEQYPNIAEWYIGGHSLGGSMAAAYVADHADTYEGLVLLASYSTKDLSGLDLRVLSVYGTEDGILNRENYSKYRGNLPKYAEEMILDGGNHACFGSYGPQDGDGTASIPAEKQLEATIERVHAFLAA